jgi:hypothetical protein
MVRLPDYGDIRQTMFCVHCGGGAETRDHIPPKVFLDEPFPEDLPFVPSCASCNQGASADEEYVACLIDCVVSGSIDPERMRRNKVKRILGAKPALASRLSGASRKTASGIAIDPEMSRVRRVVLKMARGHASYDLSEPQLEGPSAIVIAPLHLLAEADRETFERPIGSAKLAGCPEVGSRAMQRLVDGDPGSSLWLVIQPGRYRYMTSMGGGLAVRMVIGEYLACEVVW